MQSWVQGVGRFIISRISIGETGAVVCLNRLDFKVSHPHQLFEKLNRGKGGSVVVGLQATPSGRAVNGRKLIIFSSAYPLWDKFYINLHQLAFL